MSLQVCVLASGSSGNCTVLRTPRGVMLIDAGLGPRTTAARLRGTGVAPGDIAAICLTHLDRDHFNLNWVGALARRGIPVYCHCSRMPDIQGIAADPAFDVCLRPFDAESFEPLPGVSFRSMALAHDADGSHGFVIDGFGGRIGYATDLGRVPDSLVEAFQDLDVLAIESNYDPEMQQNSSRPQFLKQRIMGGRGHLSNEQAFGAVRRILDRSERRGCRLPGHIALLHRSRECNCPNIVRRLFERDARIAPRLTLSEQHERTPWMGPTHAPARAFVGEQLTLSWGETDARSNVPAEAGHAALS